MKIRVIVFCYNEGEVVLKIYDKLIEIMKKDSLIKNYEYDLFFINDGSIDMIIYYIKNIVVYDNYVKYFLFS